MLNTTKFFDNDSLKCLKVIERFRVLKNVQKVANELDVPKKQVSKVLMANNAYKILDEEPYKVNEKAFDIITQKESYWIGFILADGCVCTSYSHYSLRVGLASKDWEHILKLRDFLGSNYPIHFSTKKVEDKIFESVILNMTSKYLVDKLISFGIVPNKTYNFKELSVFGLHKLDFLRGFFDGDGSLSNKSCIYTIKSKLLLDTIQLLIPKNINFRMWYQKEKDCYYLGTFGNNTIEFLDKLYHNSKKETRLDRKYKKYCILKHSIASSETPSEITKSNMVESDLYGDI